MGYIYHIYSTNEPNTIYIGQHAGEETHSVKRNIGGIEGNNQSVAGNRVLQHFQGLYDNKKENSYFMSWLKRNPLNTVVVEIYDKKNNYGIDMRFFKQFFNIWNPSSNKDISAKINLLTNVSDADQSKNRSDKEVMKGCLLDAAEILHIYYYKKYGYNLMNVQMGGSRYWTSPTGSSGSRIINREMSVNDLVNMIDTDPHVVAQLQSSFTSSWKNYWKSKPVKDKIKNSLTNLYAKIINKSGGIESEFKKILNSKETELEIFNIISSLVWDSLPKIQNTIQHKIPGGYTVNVNMLTQGLYSINSDFRQLSSHWNIVSILSRAVKKSDKNVSFTDIAKFAKSLTKELKKSFQKEIDKIVDIIANYKVSLSNFFSIKYKGNQNLPLNHLIADSSFSIGASDPVAMQNYRLSLKHISYSYFAKIAQKAQADLSPVILNNFNFAVSTRWYGSVGFTTSWSFAISNILKTKADVFQDEDFLWHYIRQFLTIFVQYRGDPRFDNLKPEFKSFNKKGSFALFDKILDMNYSKFKMPKDSVFAAVPLGRRTYEEIIKWENAKIDSITEYY